VESHLQEEWGNQILTLGPLHRIQPDVLLHARQTFYRKVDALPNPRVGVFLEGTEQLEPLTSMLLKLYQNTPFSLMIHVDALSEENKKRLMVALEPIPFLYWEREDIDPYLGFLAHSEALIVSNSSSLRVAEATSLGKPLFIYPSNPLSPYIQALIHKGYASVLRADSSLFRRLILPPLQETQRVARILKEAYEAFFAVTHTRHCKSPVVG
jgi:mitochondrial fission protein ELM1